MSGFNKEAFTFPQEEGSRDSWGVSTNIPDDFFPARLPDDASLPLSRVLGLTMGISLIKENQHHTHVTLSHTISIIIINDGAFDDDDGCKEQRK